MKIVLILGALVATALAAPGVPNMPQMPNLSNLPKLPEGMDLNQLKETFYNLPTDMRDRLNDMAESYGLKMDDVENVLNDPPEMLKSYFNNAQQEEGSKNAETSEAPTGGQTQGLPDLASMMGNLDLGSMMKGMDLNGLLGGSGLGSMLQGLDVNSLMKNVDIGSIMKNVDVGSLMKNMDIGSLMSGKADIGSLMKNMDVAGIMKNVDVGSIMKNVDVGSLMKNVDLSEMMGMPMPDMKTIMGMLGLPEESEPSELVTLLSQKMKDLGLPTDSPAKMMEFAKDKLKNFRLSDIDMSSILNILEGQLEAMGVPTDNPEKMKEIFKDGMKEMGMEELGLELDTPENMAAQMKSKVLKSMGVSENADPEEIKETLTKELFEEAKRLGSNLSPDSSEEDIQSELMGVMSGHLKDMGLELDSADPHHMMGAIKNKLADMGLPMFDLANMKSNVMHMVMKQLMGKGKGKHTEL